MKKQNQIIGKRGSANDDLEKLKLRRDERKGKNNDDRCERKNEDNGKACDAYYENLIKKKKIAFNIEPDRVFDEIIYENLFIHFKINMYFY